MTYIDDKLQIKLLNELYKMENHTLFKGKTLVIYDLYQNAVDDQLALHNLHTFAKIALDPTLEVQIEQCFDQNGNLCFQYHIKGDHNQITSQMFKIEMDDSVKGLNNIWLYEKAGEDFRVVVIPIDSEMIDISAIKEEGEKDAELNVEANLRIKQSGLKGEDRQNAFKDWREEQEAKLSERCQKAASKHLKMFKIEAFLGTVLQKTEKVSLCSLVDIGRRHSTLEAFQAEFSKLFQTPETFKPQYLLHGYSSKKPKTVKQSQKEPITTILQNVKNQCVFGIKKFHAHDDAYYFPTDHIRTKIYQNIKKIKVDAFSKVINDFVNNWSRIFISSALSFGPIIKQISSFMRVEQAELRAEEAKSRAEEAESRAEEAESRAEEADIPVAQEGANANNTVDFSRENSFITHRECYDDFLVDDLELPTKDSLDSYLGADKNMKKIEKGEQTDDYVPRAAEPILFLHFFSKIHQKLSKVLKEDKKNEAHLILPYWKSALKDIYSLLKDISCTTLTEKQYSEIGCPDIQKFFNFLTFAYESLLKIQQITNRTLATHTELKSRFDQLEIKEKKILQYIINHQKKIIPSQPIHYYDIYLMIIVQNADPEMMKDLVFVFLYIHEMKAIMIARSFIHDLEKITMAIGSLALIGEKYHELLVNKRTNIDIQKIESIMARLLKIVGQEELAGRIYTKNMQFDLAHKSYQMAYVRLMGSNEEKAKKLISWGILFGDAFEFDLAQHYFRRAYTTAKSKTTKQEAVRLKFEYLGRIRVEGNEEQMRLHNRFIEDGDSLAYTNDDKDKLQKMIRLFREVRVCLTWSREAECSVMEERDLDSADSKGLFGGIFGKESSKSAILE